jgi:Tfp pilus assembly protein PilV
VPSAPPAGFGRCRAARQRGAGLVEAMIAMLVTTVVVLGVAGLVLCGVRLQQVARNATLATALALGEVERLRVLPPASPERQTGGSLIANGANHFRVVQPGTTARWVVQAGPAGAQDLTLRIVSADPNVRAADIRVLLFP